MLKTIVIAFAALITIPPIFAGQTSSKPIDANAEVVVLIHGLGRSNTAMWRMAERLEEAGYRVKRVGYSSFNQRPEQMIEAVSRQINECCNDPARRIHFVGHSLGGLMIRAYLQEFTPRQLGNTVLVGTPNRGTEVADRFQGNCLVEFLMPAALALGTDENSLPNQLAPPYYPVGIIAGVSDEDENDEYLPGVDDGLVSVESTKLAGMSDFVEVKTSHSMMRYDPQVADQVLSFLQKGQFDHSSTALAGR